MPKKYTIEFVLDFVKDASFQCLETKYYDNKTLMKWKCNECDYEWYACFSSIKNQKSGCPACANNITFTIEEVKQMGLHNGYTLISDEYTNAATIMEWRCAENHVYFSTLANIRDNRGRGCPICAGLAPLDINNLKQLAIDRGGILISNTYKNNREKLEWECSKKHRWYAHANNIKDSGTWCYECNGNIPLTIDDFKEIAIKNGGLLVSSDYSGINTKLLWECSKKHQWYATPFSIKYTRTWCPECASFKSERRMRDALTYMTNSKWIKGRPHWLGGLELDGYNTEEKIAFEYQGIQHYQYNSHFHKTEEEFKNQQKRDKRKKQILESKNIELIEIPYKYDHKTNATELNNFLESELCKIYIKRQELFSTEQYDVIRYKKDGDNIKVIYRNISDNKLYSISANGFIKKIKLNL